MKFSKEPKQGGRSAALYIRIKPEVLEKLKEIASTLGVSQADLIEKWVEESPRCFPLKVDE